MSAHIAIIGSGQLARMMALDGIPMGLRFSFMAEEKEDIVCVDQLGPVIRRSDDMSPEALYHALGKPDVITVEKEHVDVPLLSALQAFCTVHPNPKALEKFKNRHAEKRFLQSLAIPIAPYKPVRTEADLLAALDALAAPVFLKTEEEGYDGYNQYKISDDNRDHVLAEIRYPGKWVAEQGIPFEREVSFIAARATNGDIVYYPPAENNHQQGTLLTSLIPAPNLPEAIVAQGQKYLCAMLTELNYVGVMCVECFVWGDQLLVNEIAPRVHNSGHWTSKGALTSQFENHVRAVAGLALGGTDARGVCGMLNLLGVTLDAEHACNAGSFLTLYGKSVRPRRKLGHVTVVADSYDVVAKRLEVLRVQAYEGEQNGDAVS